MYALRKQKPNSENNFIDHNLQSPQFLTEKKMCYNLRNIEEKCTGYSRIGSHWAVTATAKDDCEPQGTPATTAVDNLSFDDGDRQVGIGDKRFS